ncbi:hypothetical protein SS50377_24422 [Spironucleus salmonicida]|uniref:EF-hand domain-containing protein n=1 Tax=Spironucleus salmonicida TaxID=348837 RepID=V6LP63_9EUKA|nr:hypothetical protein SS50377_24422 [Spironucleus salmonicida]|eukprot:EST46028.1 hypothetical protein SS50377_14016 [Spironucleus salmonicida]
MPITSAIELIRIINPQDLDSIRALFSGNLISLEYFTRTIQTFIPKNYLETEDQMEEIVCAIIDMFEEIDSDADGFITWNDFISYYSEASQEPTDPVQELPKSQIIFQQMQHSATSSSGKTAKVLIESILPNNAEFTEIPGTTISAIHIFNENYYFITDIGVFVSDSTFLFPKLIFEPTAPVLQGDSAQKRVFKLDDRTKERLETQAMRKLSAMGVDTQSIDVYGGLKVQSKEEEFDRNELLRGIGRQPINQLSPIVCSVLLSPLPLLMVCMRQPLFVFISLSGTQGASEPQKLASPASSLYWCAQKEMLFIGHNSGAVSAYKIKLQKKKHSIMAFLEEVNKQQLVSGDPIEQIHKICKDRNITLDEIPKEDLIRIYPELRQEIVDISIEDPEAQLEKERKRYLSKIDVSKLMQLTSKDVEIKHLITDKIFNPHVSTMESHEIKPSSVILEDPTAYIESIAQPGPLQTAIKEKKHGGVQIDVDAQFLCAQYIVNESVRKIQGDFGHWENKITDGNFRLVVAGGDGSITVCDEYLNVITTFPELHKEGIVSLHVVQDNITSIGYNNVYQIGPMAVQQQFIGKCILPEDAPDYSTSEVGKHSQYGKVKIDITESKLMKGELLKTQKHIRLIQPPRPGQPIITSFQMGNIIGVVDHDYIVTLFHAISGAHLTRTTLSLPNIHGLKFGQCFYNFNRDMGFIPIGKHMLYIKAIANEEIGETGVVWNILNDIEKEERKANKEEQLDDPSVKVSNKVPVGSISTVIQGMVVNQQIHEFAIISGDFEITFYSLLSGQPIRVVNIQTISKTISQDGQDTEEIPTEYTTIESNDNAQYFTENHVAANANNISHISDNVDRDRIDHPKDINSLLTQKKQYVSSIPKQLDPIQMLKAKEKQNLLQILGQKILSIFTDIKSRILFVVGTKGVLTFYWKTGCLFDYSGVGVLGRQLLNVENDLALSSVGNPFNEQTQKAQQTMQQNAQSAGGGFQSYSLNLDLSIILQRDNQIRSNIQGITRSMMTASDPQRHVVFLYDQLNPLEVRAISVSPSADYIAGKINSRILMNLNITYQQKMLDPCYKLKMRAISYFSQKQAFLGKVRAQQDYSKILRIIPDFLQNQGYQGLDKFNDNNNISYYKKMLSLYLNENQTYEEAHQSQVTVIEASPELALLAIGTNDSRVQLFDTSSIKFLRQGVIYLPKFANSSAVTAIKFMGSLPLIFICLSNGQCFIYTVRPLIPANILICSFNHSSYAPISIPSNNNPYENYIRKARSVQRFLLPYTDESVAVQNQLTSENEFIKHLFFHHCPEMKSSIYFQNDDASLETENIFQSGAPNLRQSTSQSQSKMPPQPIQTEGQSGQKEAFRQPESAFSTTEDNKILAFRRAYVNMPNSRLSVSTAGNTDLSPDDLENATPAQAVHQSKIPIPSQTNSLASSNQPLNNSNFHSSKLPSTSPSTPKNFIICKQILCKRSAIQGPLQSTLQLATKQGKMRKLVVKIRAACQIISVTRNCFLDFLETNLSVLVSKTAADYEKLKRKPVEFDLTDMLLNGKNVKKSEQIINSVQISDKTKKIISDFQKSRFYTKNSKQEDDYDEKFVTLTAAEQEDITTEKKGFLYRKLQQNGKEVNLPVRKIALEGLKNNVSVSQVVFCQKKQILLVGDEQGFVTSYDISKLIKNVNAQEISMKTKYIQDPQGGPPQEIILGFNEQKIEKTLFTEEYSGKVIPLLHAHENLVINYSVRCDREGISYLQLLTGTKEPAFLVIGESRRATIYDFKTSKLFGMCQRVTLDAPPSNWEKMFFSEITQEKEKSITQKKSNKLTLNELSPSSPLAEVMPYQRLEIPPPNSYPWRYMPTVNFTDTVSSSAISLNSNQVVQKTTRIIQQSIPVPSLDADPARALLKSTGLNPTILDKHKNSWTVRALISKATGGQLDSSMEQSKEIMNRLSYTKSRLDEEDLE